MCSLIAIGATMQSSIDWRDNSFHCVAVPGFQSTATQGRSGTVSPRQRCQYPRPAARALVEAGEVVLLVWRMHAVVIEREADHQRVHAEHALEVGDDRD